MYSAQAAHAKTPMAGISMSKLQSFVVFEAWIAQMTYVTEASIPWRTFRFCVHVSSQECLPVAIARDDLRDNKCFGRCFDFMKHRILLRARLEANCQKTWLERNVSADLHVWRKKFFSGMGYVEILRQIERKLKKKLLSVVKGSIRLAPLMQERRGQVSEFYIP